MSNQDDPKTSSGEDTSEEQGTETAGSSQALLTRREILKQILQYATASAGALALNIFPENLHPSTITEYRAAEIHAEESQQRGRRRKP